MTNEKIKSILEDVRPTEKTLLRGSTITSNEEGVIVDNVNSMADGFLMRVAEKHLVSLTIAFGRYFFNDMPYLKARDYLKVI